MFNTLSYARKLESTGIPREQAEAHVQIIAEIVEVDLATKQDLSEVKNELKQGIIELKQNLRELKSELEHKIDGVENRLLIKLGTLTTALLTIAVAIIAMMIKSH